MDIVIIEDSELVLVSMGQLLAEIPAVRIVGTAGTEEDAVTLILRAEPDVVLLDIGLTSGSGLNVLRRVRAEGCEARILMLTNYSFEHYREACREAGADGFFDKSRETAALLEKLNALSAPLPGGAKVDTPALPRPNLLGSAEDEILDEVLRLAVRLLDMPIAMISLLDDDRHCVGLEPDEVSQVLPLCGCSLDLNEMLIVEDLSKSPRFRDQPILRWGPAVRFCASVPIVLPGGRALGSLCVMDRKPRHLGDKDVLLLNLLVKKVVAELELRQRVVDLEEEVIRRRAAEVRIILFSSVEPSITAANSVLVRVYG